MINDSASHDNLDMCYIYSLSTYTLRSFVIWDLLNY